MERELILITVATAAVGINLLNWLQGGCLTKNQPSSILHYGEIKLLKHMAIPFKYCPILASLLVFITLICHAGNKAKHKIDCTGAKTETRKNNTITFLLKSDQKESIYLNLLEDKYSYVPKLLVISQQEPIKTVNSKTSLEIGVTNSFFSNTDFECIPGDSIEIQIVNRQIKINLLNRRFNEIAWNLSYYMKKANHISILEYYTQKTAAQLYNFPPVTQSPEETLAYSLSFLDSLQKRGVIDAVARDSFTAIYTCKFKLLQEASSNLRVTANTDSSLYLTFNFTDRIPAIVKAYLKLGLLKHFGIGNNVKGDIITMTILNYVAKTFSGNEREFLLFYCANEIKLHNSSLFEKNYESILQTFKEQETKDYFIINNNSSNIPSGYMLNSANKQISFEGLLKEKPALVTYIDFWASWCAPCRAEMPNLKNLKTQFAGLGIEFICISIDETFTDWQSANAKENLDYYTNSYIINNPRNSAIIKQIKLTSIPRYLIYNKKGNLLYADAPAPGDPALLSLLNKLLKE